MTPAHRQGKDPDGLGRAEPIAWVLAGRALVRGRLQPVEIGISEGGTIVSVGRARPGAPRHDVGDAVILPSATDLHVHFREPSRAPASESITAGTLQAALGGVGLVGEMPNTDPPVSDTDALEEKAALVLRRAAVNVLLYASPTRPARLAALARRAGGFKIYLSPTTNIPDPPPLTEVPAVLDRLVPLGLPVSVHAEDPGRFAESIRATDAVHWEARRPVAAEASAVDMLLRGPTGLRMHVAHATTAETVRRASEARLSSEVTPQHLLLNDRARGGTRVKVNPPLRDEPHRQALWEAFARGEVPCLASDHAPHDSAAKDRPFEDAPSGMPGVETMLPLLLAKVKAGELRLDVLQAAACDRPARWLGQPHGRIAPGHRANLLVVDFRRTTRLAAARLHAPCGWTAFEGWEAIFPVEHYLGGVPLVLDGEFREERRGVVVRPEYAPGEPAPPLVYGTESRR